MEIENSFTVPLPPADAWKVLLDIPRIAPCMPGAELLEAVDAATYKGKVSVRLGPVALSFVGQVRLEDIDPVNFKARAKAQGTDSKGRGGANAVVDFHLAPDAAGSTVIVRTNLNLSGSVAQYGRGVGMIKDLANQLIGQFARSLQAQLQQTAPAAALSGAPTANVQAPPAAAPINGFALMLRVLWRAVLRAFGRETP